VCEEFLHTLKADPAGGLRPGSQLRDACLLCNHLPWQRYGYPMTTWAVWTSDDELYVETPAGRRRIDLEPYERDGSGYLAPLDILRYVTLRDLVRALRSEHTLGQIFVSTQGERWFDPDSAGVAFVLRPGEPRRFELKFMFDDPTDMAGESDKAESRRLAFLLAPLVSAQRGWVKAVWLHPDAYEPPWPFVIVLSLPLNGWTVERVAHLVDNATGLLSAVSAGEFDRTVALQVLRANHPDALLGQHESVYLDVKQSHYDLDTAHGEIALAQAIAGFANAEHGGLLIVGMRGKKVPGGEVIAKVTPVTVTGRDVRRYRLAIERRVFPLVDGLEVFATDVPGGGKLLVVHVLPQAEELKPFLVHGAIVGGKVEGAFISIVRRRDEHSVPITAPAIHAMLAAGRALLRRGELPPSQ
jgi:hypothetical protein